MTIPIPSPIITPPEFSSKGLGFSPLVKAGVLLKHIYIIGELSASTPPAIIISERYSSRSLTAIFIALNELAQAASTVQFVPPKFKRLAIRPAITFPSNPGNEFSSQRTYAFFIFSTIFLVSFSEIPLRINTFSQIGYCKRDVSDPRSFMPAVTPRTTPVLSRILSLASP